MFIQEDGIYLGNEALPVADASDFSTMFNDISRMSVLLLFLYLFHQNQLE